MATFFELPLANDFPYFVVNSSGASVPASGYKLFLYISGTTTKITSYTDSTGGTPNTNPVILGSTGLPQSGANVVGIWLAQGQTVKAVFAPSTDTDPPSSPIWTRDFGANPPGINDPTNITAASEWIQGPIPTFIGATQFTLSGDQRSNFQVYRRVKTINSGGTVYGTITASTFAASTTTVTVLNDSGALDSGLSSVSYGILSVTNPSIGVAVNTWTPGLSFGGGNTGITYSPAPVGKYSRIGNQVTVTFVVNLSSKGSSTGAANITGLPFPPAANTACSCSIFFSGMTSTLVTMVGQVQSNSTIGITGLTAAATALAVMNDTNFGASTLIEGSVTYII